MRVSKAPVRFIAPVHKVRRRKTRLQPFPGDPRKYFDDLQLPDCEVRESTIPRAGFGLFLDGNVKSGDPISVYRRKIISEVQAKKLKKKVSVSIFLIPFSK